MVTGQILARSAADHGRRLFGWLALLLALSPLVAIAKDSDERAYDIAAQDLEAALLAFGRASSIDIVYDSGILRGHRSAPLKGRFSPPIAIATLLRGSALTHHFTTASAVLILPADHRATADAEEMGKAGSGTVPGAGGRTLLVLNRLRVTAGRMIGTPQADYRPFAQFVLTAIKQRLQDNPSTRGRRFQARLSVRIDGQGVVHPLALQNGSGNRTFDSELLRVLDRMPVRAAPPESMPQPIWLEIAQK